MGKALAILYLLAAPMAGLAGTGQLTVDSVRIERSGGNIELGFQIRVAENTVAKGGNMVLVPVIGSAEQRVELEPIVVRGKRSAKVEARHQLASRDSVGNMVLYINEGETTPYSAFAAHREWMRGADLFFEGYGAGCEGINGLEKMLIASDIMQPSLIEIEQRLVIENTLPDSTTADRLAVKYRFLGNAADSPAQKHMNSPEFSHTTDWDFASSIENDREHSLVVYFDLASMKVDAGFAGNNQTLVKLIAAVREIEASKDSKVVKVVIAGYASPEGKQQTNDRLARQRALRLKEFLVEKSEVDPAKVVIFNGAEDWSGLRALVAGSQMEKKREVLQIIDNVPVRAAKGGNGRLAELIRLDGGRPYRYMKEIFFPKLRSAAYIKVYYENLDEDR